MPGLSTANTSLRPIAQTTVAEWVGAIAFAPTGDRVAAAAADGSVTVLGLDGQVSLAAQHAQAATSLAFSPTGQLASGGQDGAVSIDGRLHQIGDGWISAVAWRPDGALLAAAQGRRVYSHTPDGERLSSSEEMPATVACIAWNPRGVLLAAGTYGGVRLLRGRDLGREGLLAWKGSVLQLAFSPDGRRLAHGNQDASVHFWDLRKRSELEMWGYQSKVRELAWRHDGRYLATGGGSEVTIWDFAGRGPEGSRPLTLEGHEAAITWLGFAPRSEHLASVAADGRALIWTPGATDRPRAALELSDQLTCGAWSPDGSLLAIGSADGTVAILDTHDPS